MELFKLALVLDQDRLALLSRWRSQVRQLPSAELLDTPTLNDHMPGLLDELASALRSNSAQTIPEAIIEGSAKSHGLQRLNEDFDIEEVVAEYDILRGCVHDLATEHNINLQGRPFHIINEVFDRAIGVALKTFTNYRALAVQQRRDEYLAFVAHDLRTPLLAISLAARTLERTLPTQGYTAASAQMLHLLHRSLQQVEGLVNHVLEENASVQDDEGVKPQRREFELWPAVEALIEELQPIATEAGSRLVNDVPENLVVYADANLLRRVLQNLIANAIKYTPRGVIAVGASESSTSPSIQCWVRDNGLGIAPELVDKVFEKGETASADSGGMGLGLAIVQTFIAAHGGEVVLETKEGDGSTFRFSLPRKEHRGAA